MALPAAKTTYTIDLETKSALDRLAALDALQRHAGVTRVQASRWGDAIREERQTTSGVARRAR